MATEDNTSQTEAEHQQVETYFANKYRTTSKRLNIDSHKEEVETKAIKPKWTIQLKLMWIISLIFIILSIVTISFATYYFKKDNEIRIKENNFQITELIGLTVNSYLTSTIQKSRQMAVLLESTGRVNQQKTLTDIFFENDSDIIYLGVYHSNQGKIELRKSVANIEYLQEKLLSEKDMRNLIQISSDKFQDSFHKKTLLKNLSFGQKFPLIGLSIPYSTSAFPNSALIAILKTDTILKTFENRSITQTYMIGEEGDVLAHPEIQKVLTVENFRNLSIVHDMLTSPLGNGQTRFFGEDGKASIGTYKRLPQVNSGILSIVSEDKVFEEVYNLQYRNILIMTIALCIALAGIFLFAKTISLPILELLKATGEIEKGKFDITLKASTQDEVGLLTKSFARMGKGLKERERIKDALGRFVNPAIAELALSKELKLGGENKMCTIFFSDIRGFTAMSEKLSPEEIVELLNQYFTRMVECIDLTFGIVDKFIGDAIMATWGTLDAVGNSFENGINAALMMRSMLVDFNRSRGTDEKRPIIRMGCGLNYGAVVAGQIGSENRLDYTVIGDAVNLASRIESLNKPFGTDILISEDLYKEVEGVYLVEKMKQIMVKGKSEPQTIYAVIRRMDDTDSDAPQTLSDIRKLLKIDFDEEKYNSGNPEEEEKKYKVIDSPKTNLPEQDVFPVKTKKQRAKK